MKRSRFSETQVVVILKEGEVGKPVAEICREQGDQQRDVLRMEVEVRRDGSL